MIAACYCFYYCQFVVNLMLILRFCCLGLYILILTFDFFVVFVFILFCLCFVTVLFVVSDVSDSFDFVVLDGVNLF